MTRLSAALSNALQGRWPVFMCGFRPFFVMAAASAPLLIAIWLLALFGHLPAFNPPGGSLLWHGHELIFGFAGAAIAGFALTAIPEFTGTPPIGARPLARLSLLWLLARLAYLAAGWWPEIGLWPAALINMLFWWRLVAQAAPPAWRAPRHQHASFAWALGGLALLQAGFFLTLLLGGPAADPGAWLRASVGAIMVLIVLAASRVSMAVVNGLIEQGRPGEPAAPDPVYLARPPRRKLAVFCIAACSAAEFGFGAGAITGWTALAASAAMLNLLNDWHIGRALFKRWALMLYACYWLIALGYGAMGLAWLGLPWMPSAGRHLLMAGAMGLSIFTIMAIVGRIHSGLWLDRRVWLPITAIALVLAALLRALAGLPAGQSWFMPLLMLSGGLWGACFLLFLAVTWPVLTGPRSDGQTGCAEPLERQTGANDPACRP